MKGLRRTNLLVQNSHGDVKYSIGNTDNHILITMYGVIWAQDLRRRSLSKLYNQWGVHLN